ncbi:MAG: SNF2-related protein, partial [Cyanobacteria bacterium J06642_9]
DLLEQPILLVCPTSVLGNWDREVRRFAPPLKTLIYHGDKRPHGSAFERAVTAVNLMITSYALVQRDLKDLKRVDWQGDGLLDPSYPVRRWDTPVEWVVLIDLAA